MTNKQLSKHLNSIKTHGMMLVLLLITLLQFPVFSATQWVDRIIATVGNDIITRSELQHEGFMIQKELQSRATQLPPRDEFIKQVLERLVMKKIQLQRASDIGIRIDDNTLNNAIENIAQDNKLSLVNFRKALISEGIDYKNYRKDIRDEITLQRLAQREIDQKIKISDAEVNSFLQQQLGRKDSKSYHLAHILISLPEAATSEDLTLAKAKINKILADHQDGTDFASLAVAHSNGQQALKGGDLGWRNSDQLPTIFAKAIKSMKKGQVSEAIRSPSGFHLVKIMEIKDSSTPEVTQTHARHILIKDVDPTKPAREKLNNIRKRLTSGESFTQLAKEFSEDKGSAVKGGDLGWASPGAFVPAFEAAMNDLKHNEVSQPFQSTFGWHIIQVLDRRTATVSEKALKDRARGFLFKQKKEEAELLWLRKLRDEAYINIHETS